MPDVGSIGVFVREVPVPGPAFLFALIGSAAAESDK